MSQITFTAYCRAEPQGSVKAFMVRGKPRLTSDNVRLKPYRHVITQIARMEMAAMGIEEPLAGPRKPVSMVIEFMFVRPSSIKHRALPAVKPDLDKLIRATLDGLTGILFADDAQVVEVTATKVYGPVDQVHVSARVI